MSLFSETDKQSIRMMVGVKLGGPRHVPPFDIVASPVLKGGLRTVYAMPKGENIDATEQRQVAEFVADIHAQWHGGEYGPAYAEAYVIAADQAAIEAA
jgi:hypothetical protein